MLETTDQIDDLLRELIIEQIIKEHPTMSVDKAESIIDGELNRITDAMWTEFDFRLAMILTEINNGVYDETV